MPRPGSRPQRIEKFQLRLEASKIVVGGAENGVVFQGQGSQVGIAGQVARCSGPGQQIPQDNPVTCCRGKDDYRWLGQPVFHHSQCGLT